jgi:hypothetical protein
MDYVSASLLLFVAGIIAFIYLFCYALMSVNDMQQLGLLLILFGIFFGGWLVFIAGVSLVIAHHTLNYLRTQ